MSVLPPDVAHYECGGEAPNNETSSAESGLVPENGRNMKVMEFLDMIFWKTFGPVNGVVFEPLPTIGGLGTNDRSEPATQLVTREAIGLYSVTLLEC